MSDFIKELLALREEDDVVSAGDLKIDDQVHAKLDQEAEDDDMDAQCFGLEMEDGKVVKVYVKQEQAEDFEQALSQKLGEEDDIQTVLDELEKDFEILKVTWPDEEQEGEDEESEEDTNEDGVDPEEQDGSDSLNSEVNYDDTKKESLTLGQLFAKKILDEAKWSDEESKEYKAAATPDEDEDEGGDDEEETEEPAPEESKPTKVESKWKIERDEDGMSISNDRFSMELDADEAMDLVNKMTDKQIARFKNEHGKIVYVFTPRGSEYILKTPEYQGGFRIPQEIIDQIKEDPEK